MKPKGLTRNPAALAALALASALLTMPPAVRAGAVDIAIGLNFPLPGFWVPPPMAAPPPAVAPPPQVVFAPAPPAAPPVVVSPAPAYVVGGQPKVLKKHHPKHKQKHNNGYRLY